MTAINKDNFKFDGMYLMYYGEYEGAKTFGETHPDCHPTRTDMLRPAFVARFKYGSKPWKTWVNFICKNFSSIEDYLTAAEADSPLGAMEARGYKPRAKRAPVSRHARLAAKYAKYAGVTR